MPGGGQLTVETANKQLDDLCARESDVVAGDYIMLAVTDRGTGIPAHILNRGPVPYDEAGRKGDCLGLSMVYGFAKQSGGHTKSTARKVME